MLGQESDTNVAYCASRAKILMQILKLLLRGILNLSGKVY
ncbi:hypothetical protein FDUTEX481_05362 [Tolypothrix sp. PCC 7601]|nr:hypothetical protein FDUTEX481_05362 [Tolypothrix sp. PCC 7601]